jgi:outer membrane protein assembly factor BamE (lipoprotein component of BamABCDE complex)
MNHFPRKNLYVPAVAAACVLFSLLSGCIPISARHLPASEFNRNVDEQSTLSLDKGKTTRKDVLLSLGQPDAVMDDERTFVYSGDMTKEGNAWRFLYALPISPYSAVVGITSKTSAPQREEKYRLTVWFDEKGVVRDFKFESTKQQGQ